jgi:hypothetical protein
MPTQTRYAEQMYMPQSTDWERAQEEALARSRASVEAAESGTTTSQAQLAQGIAGTRQAMRAQAGADPSQARAAAYAGGSLGQTGATQAAILRAQELAQAREEYMQAQMGAAGQAQDWQGIYFGAKGAQRDLLLREQLERMKQQDADKAEQAARAAELMKATTMAAGMSDRRAKDAIADASAASADRTIASLDGYQYRYRPDARAMLGDAMAPGGERYGVIAQDLEQTPIGRTMVRESPAGKMVDMRAATLGGLALLGRVGERADELEDRIAALEARGRRR